MVSGLYRYGDTALARNRLARRDEPHRASSALGAPNLTDEIALLSVVSEFKKSTAQQCVLCGQEPA